MRVGMEALPPPESTAARHRPRLLAVGMLSSAITLCLPCVIALPACLPAAPEEPETEEEAPPAAAEEAAPEAAAAAEEEAELKDEL